MVTLLRKVFGRSGSAIDPVRFLRTKGVTL